MTHLYQKIQTLETNIKYWRKKLVEEMPKDYWGGPHAQTQYEREINHEITRLTKQLIRLQRKEAAEK